MIKKKLYTLHIARNNLLLQQVFHIKNNYSILKKCIEILHHQQYIPEWFPCKKITLQEM